MDTGKVEYAPDYKSSSAVSEGERLRRLVKDSTVNTMAFDAIGVHKFNAEHQRLKDAVVECAKALSREVDCCCFEAHFDISSARAGCDLLRTTSTLTAFEAEHEIGG